MVQVIPNQAEIVGKVIELTESMASPDYLDALIVVDDVRELPGVANLLTWAKGKALSVQVPRLRTKELGLTINQMLKCKVHKAGPNVHYAAGETMDVI
jgi:hypothetical protein